MAEFPRHLASLVLAACLAASVHARDVVPIDTIAVADGIAMLIGDGGNVGVSTGSNGTFVIDDQYAPQYDVIRAAIAKLDPSPVRFVINTHWHGDHTGGNEQMGTDGAIIVAHENVRQRLSTDQVIAFFDMKAPASPPAAWPLVTFSKDLTFHFNGDEIHVFHVLNAHTDGDAVIHFRRANVIHTGDVFFNGRYPFIDAGAGGSITGMITAVEAILALADAKTKIIPGHGPLTDRKGLEAYRDMLKSTHDAITTLMIAGNSPDEVVGAKPTAAWDGAWGGAFIKPDVYVRMIIDSVTRSTLE